MNQIGTLSETLDTIALGATQRLRVDHLAPLGRDRGHDHRRPRGRDQRGPDQDRRAVALGPRGEVQPAAADRGGARRGGRTSRPAAFRAPGARRGYAAMRHERRASSAARRSSARSGPATDPPEIARAARARRHGLLPPQLLARQPGRAPGAHRSACAPSRGSAAARSRSWPTCRARSCASAPLPEPRHAGDGRGRS